MSETYKIQYSPESVADLKNIYSYIAFKLLVPETAEQQVNRIRDKIRSLDFMPEKYAFVDWEPWKSRNTHKVPVDNYVIIYIVDSDNLEVTIVRIFYSGQDIDDILRDE